MGRIKLRRNAAKERGPFDETPGIWLSWELEKRPTDEWQLLHADEIARGEQPEPADEDMFVGINVYGHMAFPKRNVAPKNYPRGRTLMLTLTEVAFTEFRAEIMADIERQKAPEEPVDHRAELADIGARALAAVRAPKEPIGQAAIAPPEPEPEVDAEHLTVPPPAEEAPPSLLKRILGRGKK